MCGGRSAQVHSRDVHVRRHSTNLVSSSQLRCVAAGLLSIRLGITASNGKPLSLGICLFALRQVNTLHHIRWAGLGAYSLASIRTADRARGLYPLNQFAAFAQRHPLSLLARQTTQRPAQGRCTGTRTAAREGRGASGVSCQSKYHWTVS